MPKRQDKIKKVEKDNKNNFSEVLMDELRIEREKKMIMWTGVIFFMVLICGLWLSSFKNQIILSSGETIISPGTISAVIEDISYNVTNLGGQAVAIKNSVSSVVDSVDESVSSSSVNKEVIDSMLIIGELRAVLESEINSTSSDEAKLPVLE